MNPARGEATIEIAGERLTLRPSFEALVAAEEELGSLFELVERAAAGGLKLGEIVTLFWHCLGERAGRPGREQVGEAVAELGLGNATPVLRVLLSQILQGRVSG